MAKAILGHVGGPDPRLMAEVARLRRRVGELEAEVTRLSAENQALLTQSLDGSLTGSLNETLARQFCRVLGPGDEDTMPRPQEVTSAKLTGKVQAVKGNVAHLIYEGTLTGSHLSFATLRATKSTPSRSRTWSTRPRCECSACA